MNHQNKNIMRELKDYFCNAEQSKELIELGFSGAVLAVHLGSNLRQIPLAYNLNAHEIKAPLRSQALDFFRDLGWSGYVRDYTAERHVYCINKITQEYVIKAYKHMKVITYTDIKNSHEDFNVVESNLIDRLIELEKEARNGN